METKVIGLQRFGIYVMKQSFLNCDFNLVSFGWLDCGKRACEKTALSVSIAALWDAINDQRYIR